MGRGSLVLPTPRRKIRYSVSTTARAVVRVFYGVRMQIVWQQEKSAMEEKREQLYKAQLDVQDRIRKAASLGDLSENAEYHFAKEENRSIQHQLAELEKKLRQVSVVSTDNVP